MGENKWGKHSLHCPRKSCSQSKEKPKNIYLTSAAMFPFVPHPGPQRLSPCKNTLFFFFFSFNIYYRHCSLFVSTSLKATYKWVQTFKWHRTLLPLNSVPIHWHRILCPFCANTLAQDTLDSFLGHSSSRRIQSMDIDRADFHLPWWFCNVCT